MTGDTLVLEHDFDEDNARHYLNGVNTVLHCHHYATLYVQIAMETDSLDLLQDVAEESFYEVITSYYENHDVSDVDERMTVAAQYYAAIGLGTLNVADVDETGGRVVLPNSHMDRGWIEKTGDTYDEPVNYTSAGYIAAMFAAAYDEPVGTYAVTETQSIVTGADKSVFTVERREQ